MTWMVVAMGVAMVAMLVMALAMRVMAKAGFPSQRRIPIGPDDEVVEVLGCSIRYRDIPGEGIPIVFLHGSNLSLDEFDEISAGLEGRRRVALDLPGFGGSDRPALRYDIDSHMRFLVAFLDELEIDRAILVGHSFGGTMAMWYGSHVPERVAGAVVIQSPGPPGSMVMRWPKSLFVKPGIWNRIGFWLCNNWLYRICYPESIAIQDLGLTNSIFDDEFTTAMSNVTQPTLLLMARTDKRIPWWVAEEYADSLPNAQLVVLPDEAEHHAQRFCPEFVAAQIRTYLDQVDPLGPKRPLVPS